MSSERIVKHNTGNSFHFYIHSTDLVDGHGPTTEVFVERIRGGMGRKQKNIKGNKEMSSLTKRSPALATTPADVKPSVEPWCLEITANGPLSDAHMAWLTHREVEPRLREIMVNEPLSDDHMWLLAQ